MEMKQSQFEMDHFPEPVRLPFQRFDLVVDTFDLSACDFVLEIIQQHPSVSGNRVSNLDQSLDSRISGVPAPGL
jgi:hypothetical protein